MVKNRDHRTTTDIDNDRSVTVTGRTGTIRLPADYVTEHLELGYAQTSHATQGRTVDTALLLVDTPTDVVNTPTGTMRVSTPEVTVLDLVSFPDESGALFNVATVVGEMLVEDAIDVGRLAEAAVGYPVSIVQRTGWLLDFMAERVEVEVDTEPLLPLTSARVTPTPLDPSFGRAGTLDPLWNVTVPQPLDEESS